MGVASCVIGGATRTLVTALLRRFGGETRETLRVYEMRFDLRQRRGGVSTQVAIDHAAERAAIQRHGLLTLPDHHLHELLIERIAFEIGQAIERGLMRATSAMR